MASILHYIRFTIYLIQNCYKMMTSVEEIHFIQQFHLFLPYAEGNW